MSHYTYILILLFSALIPLIFTLEPNFKFYKKLPKLLGAIAIGASVFITWDVAFTKIGVWGFNENYLLGINVFNLPLEEILFFIIIPYCCIFLYEAFYYHFNFDPFKKISKFISIALIIFTSIIALMNIDKSYTFSAMLALGLTIILAEFIFKNKELSKFYLVFLIIIIPFSIDNGILTGSFLEEPVVWYNDNENLGFRFGTIPFEDIFYAMSLILLDFCLFKSFQKAN
jgi:lycopene cyclase domain-containing protein